MYISCVFVTILYVYNHLYDIISITRNILTKRLKCTNILKYLANGLLDYGRLFIKLIIEMEWCVIIL